MTHCSLLCEGIYKICIIHSLSSNVCLVRFNIKVTPWGKMKPVNKEKERKYNPYTNDFFPILRKSEPLIVSIQSTSL